MANVLDTIVGLVIGGIFLGATAVTVINGFQTGGLVSASSAVSSIFGLLPLMFIFAAVLVLYGYVRHQKGSAA